MIFKKWLNNKLMEKSGSFIFFLCPDGDPDHSQNSMGSKLDQDSSSHFHKDPTSSICVFLLTNRQTVMNLPPWQR